MDPTGKEKQTPAKTTLAAHSRQGEVQSRVEVLERGASCKTGIDGEHMWRPYAPTWREGTSEVK